MKYHFGIYVFQLNNGIDATYAYVINFLTI